MYLNHDLLSLFKTYLPLQLHSGTGIPSFNLLDVLGTYSVDTNVLTSEAHAWLVYLIALVLSSRIQNTDRGFPERLEAFQRHGIHSLVTDPG